MSDAWLKAPYIHSSDMTNKWSLEKKVDMYYRGLQVGWHKFATRIHACAEFSIQDPHMRRFLSQICAS